MLRRNTISMIVLPKVDCFFVFPVGSTVCWINGFCRIMPKNTLLVNLRTSSQSDFLHRVSLSILWQTGNEKIEYSKRTTVITTIMIMSTESVTGRMAASVSSRARTPSAGSLASAFPFASVLLSSWRWFWYQFLATLKRYKTMLMIENRGIPYPNIIKLFPKRKFIMPGKSIPCAMLKKLLFSLFAR